MLSYQDLKSLTKVELEKELVKAREEQQKLRITVKTKHAKDTSAVGKNKKLIARLCTAIKEVAIEEMVEKANKID